MLKIRRQGAAANTGKGPGDERKRTWGRVHSQKGNHLGVVKRQSKAYQRNAPRGTGLAEVSANRRWGGREGETKEKGRNKDEIICSVKKESGRFEDREFFFLKPVRQGAQMRKR